MRTFLVTFHKLVLDCRGHDHRAVQQQAVVSACSGEAAADTAKLLFCEAASIADWRMRADTFEVVRLAGAAVERRRKPTAALGRTGFSGSAL
ncbi:hypothetical protein [Methylobacterium sp. P5_C11]